MDGVDTPIGPRDRFDPAEFLQGPSPFVFELEDALEIDSLCSIAGVTVTVSGVMFASDLQIKPFAFSHTPNSNRTIATTRQHIGSGWLLRVRAVATAGTPLVGQCFVWLRTCRGLTAAALVNGEITTGYVTANKSIFLPGAQPTNPLDEEGATLSITVSNPAAGVDWSQTVPTGARWKLTALTAQLVAANAGGARSPRLIIDDGTTTLFEGPAPVTQAINTTSIYSFGQGAGGPTTADVGFVEAPIPNDLWLPSGFRVRMATGAINAADQWSAIRLLVQEWLEGN